jgi:dihydrofolate reductase
VQQFANLNLNEYTLVVVPVIPGAGKYLFEDAKKMNLKLLKQKPLEMELFYCATGQQKRRN